MVEHNLQYRLFILYSVHSIESMDSILILVNLELIVENGVDSIVHNPIEPYSKLLSPFHTEFDQLRCFEANLVLSQNYTLCPIKFTNLKS